MKKKKCRSDEKFLYPLSVEVESIEDGEKCFAQILACDFLIFKDHKHIRKASEEKSHKTA